MMEAKEQITRWRLILGQESDKRLSGMGDGDMSLSHEQDLMDQALASIYNRTELGGFGGQNNPGRGAGRGLQSADQPLAWRCADTV